MGRERYGRSSRLSWWTWGTWIYILAGSLRQRWCELLHRVPSFDFYRIRMPTIKSTTENKSHSWRFLPETSWISDVGELSSVDTIINDGHAIINSLYIAHTEVVLNILFQAMGNSAAENKAHMSEILCPRLSHSEECQLWTPDTCVNLELKLISITFKLLTVRPTSMALDKRIRSVVRLVLPLEVHRLYSTKTNLATKLRLRSVYPQSLKNKIHISRNIRESYQGCLWRTSGLIY